MRRDGEAVGVDAEQVVPGHIVLMEAGNICIREPGKRVKSKV